MSKYNINEKIKKILKNIKNKKKQKKINSNKYKSSFLKHNLIRNSHRKSIMEIIIKCIVLFVLKIGVYGTNWQSKIKNKAVVEEAYKKIMDSNFIFLPVAFAFSLVMAFVPLILLIHIIIGSNEFILGEVNWMLTSMFGQYAIITIDISLLFKTLSGAISLILLILLSSWISASGLSKFIYSCSLIYKHDKPGNFFTNRLRGVAIVIGIAIYLSLVFSFFTGISIIIHQFSWLINHHFLYMFINKIISLIIITLSLYIGNCLLFKFSPRFKLTWKQIHPGAVIAAIPSALFLFLFTTITSYTLNYSSIGGNLSSFMTMSMAALVFSYFIYVGVIANASFYNIYVGKSTRGKNIATN